MSSSARRERRAVVGAPGLGLRSIGASRPRHGSPKPAPPRTTRTAMRALEARGPGRCLDRIPARGVRIFLGEHPANPIRRAPESEHRQPPRPGDRPLATMSARARNHPAPRPGGPAACRERTPAGQGSRTCRWPAAAAPALPRTRRCCISASALLDIARALNRLCPAPALIARSASLIAVG